MARIFRGPDYPIGMPLEVIERNAAPFLEQHGTTGDVLILTVPSVADDARLRRWLVRFQRSTMSPAILSTGYRWLTEADVTGVLSSITVPTLVIHRKCNQYHRVAFGMHVADRVAGAKWVELEGADSSPVLSGVFGDRVDLVGDQTVGLTMHRTGILSGICFYQTEDLACRLVDPIPQIADAVRSLGCQIRLMRLSRIRRGNTAFDRVHVHEE